MLGRVPAAGRHAHLVEQAIRQAITTLPAELARIITWDQGKEMAYHADLTIATGIRVYFCDPHAPWQRGSNENTNGLLRQYLPKGTDLSLHSAADLTRIAASLNGRPRRTLGYMTPSEKAHRASCAHHLKPTCRASPDGGQCLVCLSLLDVRHIGSA